MGRFTNIIKRYFVRKRLKDISILIMDVDGTIATQEIMYIDGYRESKSFSVRDGVGVKHLLRAGIKLLCVSSRSSHAVKKRLHEIGIGEIYLGVKDKKDFIARLINDRHWVKRNVAYMGDDYNDIPVKDVVGFFFAPNDAHKEIKKLANYVTSYDGGYGAVREVADLILWVNKLYKKFYREDVYKLFKEQ
jgi:3-deoxy-D-manno-octulosonate 8-phosphate phosphatase (KDO 8-P phosphatase)